MKTRTTRAGAMLASVAISCVMSAARADDDAGRWYFVPQAGALYVDDERAVESSDVLAGIAIGRHLSERWSLELNANGASLSAEADPALELYSVSLDALRAFRQERSFAPYVTFGAGALRSAPEGAASDTDPMAQIGAGIHWRFGENRRGSGAFGLRPEIKARWSDSNRGSMLDYLAHVGFQFSFGARRAVGDDARRPAATSSHAATDLQGARPAPETTVPPPAREPQPPPLESQPQATIVVLPVVWFAVDSATLSADARAALDGLANTLRSHPSLQVELQGHTDSTGGEAHNLALSIRRAEAARDHLLRRNVPAAQLSARGLSALRPVASNDTREGRARNRRVDVIAPDPPNDLVIRREQLR